MPWGSESEVQMAIADYLQYLFPRDESHVLWFSIPNEGKVKPQTGKRLNQMGRLAGVADMVLVRGWSGQYPLAACVPEVFFAEVKAPKGRLTVSQKDFRDNCQVLEIPWALWRSVTDCETSLKEWGLL